MTLTTAEAYKLTTLVSDLVRASVDLSWKGNEGPEMILKIEERHRKARKAFNDYLKQLQENKE